jgi:hypothetical protein
MNNLPQQPSPEAIEMLAKLMLLRAKRESPELFTGQVNNGSIKRSVRVPEQLLLPLANYAYRLPR